MALSQHEVVFSAEMLEEYLAVAGRSKHAQYRRAMLAIIRAIHSLGHHVEAGRSPYRLDDPADEVYLAAAVAGDAAGMVTGNHRHFREPAYGSVRVLSPRQFVDLFGC